MRQDDRFVADYLNASAAAAARLAADDGALRSIISMAAMTTSALRAGGKLLVAGNGGSAGDAQHIAGEFVSRLMFDRAPLPAIALTTDTSALTAIANDYGYEHVFERQVLALAKPGDVFLGISTSGRSRNVLRGFEAARAVGAATIGLAGHDGGAMRSLCDLLLEVPADRTALIQQLHITAAHVFCALVEDAMFPRAPAEAATAG